MKRAASRISLFSLCGLLSLGLLTPACGLFASAPTPARVVAPSGATATAAVDAAPGDVRKVGDFSVHRFSGSYQKAPLTLTEEVVAKEDGLWLIDYTLEDEAGTSKLRVHFDPRTDSVVRVARVVNTIEIVLPLSTYQHMIDRTSFAADSNDGQIASAHATCLVGPRELDCETKSYKVWVGKQPATLTVARSSSVPNGDVSGDITASDGSVIYSSELLEMGNGAAPKLGVASR